MQNQNIIQLIENLKGRKSYEEKKASKLGFSSLYNYFEDKILKEKQMIEDKKKELEEIKKNNDLKSNENKSCSCC
jgi:predicted metalloendopeptidase